MFNNVLQCLVSHTMIGIVGQAAANHLRDRNNATAIGNNSTEIGDDAAGIVNITTKVIPC